MSQKNQSRQNMSNSILKGGSNSAKFPIYASSVNCETRMKFLGSWRPILRNVLEQYRRNTDSSRETIIKRLINKNPSLTLLILDFFGITSGLDHDEENDNKEIQKYMKNIDMDEVEPMTSKQSPIFFLLREKYSNRATDAFLDMIVCFISEFIGCVEYSSTNSMSSNPSKVESQDLDLFQGDLK